MYISIFALKSIAICFYLTFLLFTLSSAALVPDDEEFPTDNSYNDTRAFSITNGIPYRAPVIPQPGVPGADADPPGVHVYESLSDVPTAKLLARTLSQRQCLSSSSCWDPYICGHRCEPILLGIRSFCKRNGQSDWVRCTKPRKYKRCFAKVCFRRAITSVGKNVKDSGRKPHSFEDPYSVAVVRWKRKDFQYGSKIKEKRIRKILLDE